ncbi:LPXTG cell wall anchor domain-containing protein [Lactobacillus amylovorus]
MSDKNIAHDHADIVENVVYTPEIQKLDVTYHDDTTNTDLKKDEISGDSNSVASKDGTPYTTGSSIDDYKNKGYELVSDSTDGKQLTFDSDSSVDQHFVVHLKHGTVTVTPDDKNPVEPGDKINPNDPDPNSPKYQDDVKHDNLAKDAKQTIHYEGAGTDTPADNVTTQKDAFTRTVTYDKVTGKSTTSKWSKTKTTFDKVDNPVVKGYTTKNKQAGGLTATPEDPEVTDTVVYTPNGSIVPVDPNGNPIPGTHPVPYETDPTDPTKVVDGKVPEVPGWTPKNGAPVKPSDPTKDTEVPYDHTMTPGETTATGKVEGLPEKPAKSAKAPAEKLVKTPVKAPKTVKTAEPAKTISIKESAQAQDQLPQTGEDNSKAAFGLGLASILGGIGILGAFKRKKKEN